MVAAWVTRAVCVLAFVDGGGGGVFCFVVIPLPPPPPKKYWNRPVCLSMSVSGFVKVMVRAYIIKI